MREGREVRKARGNRGSVVVGLAVALATLVPAAGPLAAQRAELIPQLGLFEGLSSMGTAEDEEGSAFTLGERERGFAYGLAVQFGAHTPAGVRGSVLLGTGSDVPVTGPGCSAEDACTIENSLRVITGALVLRPLPGLVVVRPYVLAGGGWKRFGFDESELETRGLEMAIEDQTNTAWQLGVGVEVGLGVTAGVIELSDYISGFDVEEERGDGKTQHDLFLTVGLRL